MSTAQARGLGAARIYLDRRVLTFLFLGFSAGLPILLIFSTLGLWLQEAGIDKKTVTMFSWAALGYSFKFIWAPLIDALPLPLLTRALGKRRSWLLLAQGLVIAAILLMASTDPTQAGALNIMAAGAVLLGFSSATQDVLIDSYRIEAAPDDTAMQTAMSASYVGGYRLGMIAAGAGSLYLASWFGTSKEHYLYSAWQNTYYAMAAIMLIGVATTLLIREPAANRERTTRFSLSENLRLLAMFVLAIAGFIGAFRLLGSALPQSGDPLLSFGLETLRLGGSLLAALMIGFIAIRIGITPAHIAKQAFVEPLADFFRRYGKKALLLLALIGLYRISDIVAGTISNLFYADLGYSKVEIGHAVKTFGVIAAIAGGFVGGILANRYSIMKMMMLGAIASAATNLLFILLSQMGHQFTMLLAVVGFDNLAAGLASAVFVAFLSALTNIRFSAVQYALFSSLMTLFPKILGGYSGGIVESIGYPAFFAFSAAIGIPILLLIWLADKHLFRQAP